MGALEFITRSDAPTSKQAFNEAVEKAQYEYGHGGYTGTIAEKGSFKEFTVPEGVDPRELATVVLEDYKVIPDHLIPHSALIESIRRVALDKWGGGGCLSQAERRRLSLFWNGF